MTSMATEIEAVEVVEEQQADACEGRYEAMPGCPRAATWGMVHTCCGWVRKVCNEHREELEQWLDGDWLPEQYVECNMCGHSCMPVSRWRSFLRFERL